MKPSTLYHPVKVEASGCKTCSPVRTAFSVIMIPTVLHFCACCNSRICVQEERFSQQGRKIGEQDILEGVFSPRKRVFENWSGGSEGFSYTLRFRGCVCMFVWWGYSMYKRSHVFMWMCIFKCLCVFKWRQSGSVRQGYREARRANPSPITWLQASVLSTS